MHHVGGPDVNDLEIPSVLALPSAHFEPTWWYSTHLGYVLRFKKCVSVGSLSSALRVWEDTDSQNREREAVVEMKVHPKAVIS